MDERERFTKTPVVYDIAGTNAVDVRRDLAVPGASGPVLADIYAPPRSSRPPRTAAVVIVAGYPDAGFERILGCRFKEMASVTSWARLFAASGMTAIAYANRDPAPDLDAVLGYLRAEAATIGIDPSRVALWASSGNGPLAVSRVSTGAANAVAALVLCYAFALDLGDSTAVADAARTFRFANPAAGRTLDDLRDDLPMLVVRAGRDETPGLNASLDRFVEAALRRNLPLTLVNHPTGPHAFDLFHDIEETRAAIRQVLGFLAARLAPEPGTWNRPRTPGTWNLHHPS